MHTADQDHRAAASGSVLVSGFAVQIANPGMLMMMMELTNGPVAAACSIHPTRTHQQQQHKTHPTAIF